MNRYLAGVKKGLEQNGINYEVVESKGSGLLSKYILYPLQALKNRNNVGSHLVISERYSYLLFFMRNKNTTIVCHDLHTLYKEAKTKVLNLIVYKFFLRCMKMSNQIVCVSNHTKNDLLKYLPSAVNSKLKVVHNGIEEFWVNPIVDDKGLSFQLDLLTSKKILLSIGTDAWYKNNEWSIELLSMLPSDFTLLRVGGFNGNNQKLIRKLNLQERIVYKESLTDKELKFAYSQAQALLFPSISEGFGWPAVEASLCNCPVITIGNEATDEIIGKIAYKVNSKDEAVTLITKSDLLTDSTKVHLSSWKQQVKQLLEN